MHSSIPLPSRALSRPNPRSLWDAASLEARRLSGRGVSCSVRAAWSQTDSPRLPPSIPTSSTGALVRRRHRRRSLSSPCFAAASSPLSGNNNDNNTESPSPSPSSPSSLDDPETVALADRLLAVFATRDPAKEWRALIGGSAEWPRLRPAVLERADAVAAAEKDPASRLAARRFARKLRAVSDELESYDAEIARYLAAPDVEWEPMVAAGRRRLPVALFEHARARCRGMAAAEAAAQRKGQKDASNVNDSALRRKREELVKAVTRLGALVAAFDAVDAGFENDGEGEGGAESGEEFKRAMRDAASDFDDLLKSADSLPEADRRIDALAESGRLTPALMLTMAKAYSAAKESTFTREEVKDVMVHLYTKAKASFNAQRPAELRILKRLVWFEGETDLRSALRDAFEEEDGKKSGSPLVLGLDGGGSGRGLGGGFDNSNVDIAAERARLERELSAAQARAKEAARLEAAPIPQGAVDYLSTTPPKLLKAVESILRAFDESTTTKGGGGDPSVIGTTATQRARARSNAAKLQGTSPEAVVRLRKIRSMILKEFM